MLRCFPAVFPLLSSLIAAAAAQDAPRSSECLAMSNAPARATPVSLRLTAAKMDEVAIDVRTERTLQISRDTLPGTPTVVILRGV